MTNDAVQNDCEEQVEYVSIKFLLKQVYAAHYTKVKELESEIKTLKQELKNKQKVPECQKCKEMEAAYSACKDEYKNAVLEQTRRLKELESKFSAIENKHKKSSLDHEIHGVLDETRSRLMPDTLNESLNFPETEENIDIDPKEKSVKPLHYITSNPVTLDSIENISETSLHSSKADTEKTNHDGRCPSKSRSFLLSNRKSSASSIDDEVLIPETVGLIRSPIPTYSGSPKSKVNSGKENKNVENATEKSNISKKRAFNDETSHKIKSSISSRKSEGSSSEINTSMTSISPTPTSTSTKRKKLDKDPKGWSISSKDFSYGSHSSTSSLILPVEHQEKGVDLVTSDDDFQSSDPTTDNSRSWKTSNKKSLQKKQLTIRGIKNTSCFKMTIDSPPENFKKPNYKQTKLSMSAFHSQKKKNTGDIEESAQTVQNEHVISEKGAEGECSGRNISFNETSFACLSELASLANGDTTHIQDSLLSMRLKSEETTLDESATFCHFNKDFHRKESDDDTLCQDVFLDDVPQLPKDHHKNENNQVEFCDSFDRVPAAEEPNYKYKEDAVRGKAKRKQLKAFECQECEKYYNELGLSEEEKKERLKQCSKHRAKYVPPSTPDHFWELDFPDTEESKARGYQAETQKVQLKTRRRRPLE